MSKIKLYTITRIPMMENPTSFALIEDLYLMSLIYESINTCSDNKIGRRKKNPNHKYAQSLGLGRFYQSRRKSESILLLLLLLSQYEKAGTPRVSKQ